MLPDIDGVFRIGSDSADIQITFENLQQDLPPEICLCVTLCKLF